MARKKVIGWSIHLLWRLIMFDHQKKHAEKPSISLQNNTHGREKKTISSSNETLKKFNRNDSNGKTIEPNQQQQQKTIPSNNNDKKKL